MRRRTELREAAAAAGAGFNGGEAIEQTFPEIPERRPAREEGYETASWWATYGRGAASN